MNKLSSVTPIDEEVMKKLMKTLRSIKPDPLERMPTVDGTLEGLRSDIRDLQERVRELERANSKLEEREYYRGRTVNKTFAGH